VPFPLPFPPFVASTQLEIDLITMRRPELIALSTIALVLVLIPLPWHWKARNIATLSTIFWIAGDNLIHLVNASLWAGNVIDKAPVWCDISTFLFFSAPPRPTGGTASLTPLTSSSSNSDQILPRWMDRNTMRCIMPGIPSRSSSFD
jgi:hypothetical protein